MKERIILAIETSCDETAIAILQGHNKVLANVISSQIAQHKDSGGVVPELASRLHLDNIDVVFEQALRDAKITIEDIDLIAVVNGPGLVGALHVGLIFAKSLSYINNIPLIDIHHIAAHIYASSLVDEFSFPLLALVVSGGHTQLVLMKDHLDFEIIGQTRDDAIGETYDKVARILNLEYPGGPLIDKLAKTGKNIYDFPRPLIDDSYDFSYSGLKSAVINKVNQLNMKKEEFNIEDIATSFQESAIYPLITKTLKAIKEYDIKHVVLAGGVSANSYLRQQIIDNLQELDVKLTLPELITCTDNALMVAACASYYEQGHNNLELSVEPNKILRK